MNSIYDLSWSETSFLAKLKLFFKSNQQEMKKMHLYDSEVWAEGCSMLSSTYYSIVGTAFSQLKASLQPKWLAPVQITAWCFTWLLLAAWCYWRMLHFSNCVVKLLGYDGMSADQCDVRQSILRRRGKYDEAKKCIHAAFTKNVEKAHTRGLLCVGLADIYRHEGNWRNAEAEVEIAVIEAERAEMLDPRQAARIYRYCANITDFIGQGDPILASQLRSKAQILAQETGAKDQLLKL